MSLNETTHNWPAQDDSVAPLGEARDVVTLSLADTLKHTLPRHILAPSAAVRHLKVSDVTGLVLRGPSAPDLILSPLTAPDFDALDLAEVLQRRGFAGRYLVLAPSEMPDIPLIRSELTDASGTLNIDIVALDGQSRLHSV